MNLNTVSMVVSWVIGLGGLTGYLVQLAKLGPERKKINADLFRAGLDSAKEINDATKALIEPYVEQIKFLRSELATAQTNNAAFRDELDAARSEIASLRSEIAGLRAGLDSQQR